MAIGRLERAQSALVSGGALLCGFSYVDLSPGQFAWLHEHRPEAITPGHRAGPDERLRS